MNEDETNALSQPNNDDTNTGQKKTDPSEQLTPEHPRFKQVIEEKNALKAEVDELRNEMKAMKDNIATRQDRQNDETLTPDEEASLLRIEKELKKRESFVTKDDFKVQSRGIVFSKLSDKHDGSDKLPKFIPVDVVSYAKANGFDADSEHGLDAAYRDMHFEAIVQKRAQGVIDVPDSEKPGGRGAQSPKKDDEFTQEEIAKMSSDQYEKNRDKILAQMKPQRTIEY